MNIFATSSCPIECAQALDDKRLNKLQLETAELLALAVWWHHGSEGLSALGLLDRLRKSHVNHPCAVWARQTASNYSWLAAHGAALNAEWSHRFKRVHATSSEIFILEDLWSIMPPGAQTPFPRCCRNLERGVDCTHIEDIHEAYRSYLCQRWPTDKLPPRWTNRLPPKWKTTP